MSKCDCKSIDVHDDWCSSHPANVMREYDEELRAENEKLKAEVSAQAAVIEGAPWYRDIEILQRDNARLRALLTEAAENIAFYDQFAKQDLLPRIRDALKGDQSRDASNGS